jgi:hypothetical protein
MKNKNLLSLITGLAIIASPAVYAENQSACETVLCLAGPYQGQSGGSQCNGPIQRYFDINAFDGAGDFDPSQTAQDRLEFLNGCQSADPAWKNGINSIFGSIQG